MQEVVKPETERLQRILWLYRDTMIFDICWSVSNIPLHGSSQKEEIGTTLDESRCLNIVAL